MPDRFISEKEVLESMKSKESTITVLTSRLPYPQHGGDKLRIYEICKYLSKHHKLNLIAVCSEKKELVLDIPQDDVFSKVERVYISPIYRILNLIMGLFAEVPMQVAMFRSNSLKRLVKKSSQESDILLVHLVRMAPYQSVYNGPSILEMTDAISLNYDRVSRTSINILKKLIFRWESNRLTKYERTCAELFSETVLVSGHDIKSMSSPQEKPIVISNGVYVKDSNYLTFGEKIVFGIVGNFSSIQNKDALQYFIKDISPLLRSEFSFKLKVIGRIPKKLAQNLAKYNFIEVTGEVASIKEALGDVHIGICPIRQGAGVQNKILEYMSCTIPVISSSIGLQGLFAKDGDQILVADDPGQFISSVRELATNEDLAKRLAINGYNYVREYHSWDFIMADYQKLVKNVVGKSSLNMEL